MPLTHLLLALLVVIVWGINFLFVKLALDEISPLLLCALRFFLASVPAIFFIKPPAVSFRIVILYGMVTFALQFSLFFIGMSIGMTPGMASLIMQTQVFFSMLFAVILLGETLNAWQIIGALVSFAGVGIVGLHFDSNITLLGFLCMLAAAATWGLGNLITKKTNKISMIALVVWGSFVASLPLLLFSLIFEGPEAIVRSWQHSTIQAVFSLAYIVYLSTWFGYGVWNWLVSRYPVGAVVPFTLLVPVVGVLSSTLVLGEPFQSWKLVACLLVITGLFINLFGARLFKARVRQEVS
ncbi:putative amino-acid metabolite efflux pump [Legionella massiliensis]|uniref:Putative amino-acid metabolite efflux pump n=1 Tax=Legionella massiliensis TaxID=1034943 RepID=A0A078L0D1_9GAMM|nr:EamA family transporter [Legionella massiliensis]CDZ78616.1 putative amino-acid metabolite efflux pump [Legionella massiliensis]CEE14354.1 putative amino-acid metabolite efflux pump [Legionella massiliensis]